MFECLIKNGDVCILDKKLNMVLNSPFTIS